MGTFTSRSRTPSRRRSRWPTYRRGHRPRRRRRSPTRRHRQRRRRRPVAVSCDKASGATFPLGATTVTCSATDKAGNTGQRSFVVTVQGPDRPDLSLSGRDTTEATGPRGAASRTPPRPPTSSTARSRRPATSPPARTFPLGTTTVTCSATDKAGNTATTPSPSRSEDTTAPDHHGARARRPRRPAGRREGDLHGQRDRPGRRHGRRSPARAVGQPFALGSTAVTCAATDDSRHNFSRRGDHHQRGGHHGAGGHHHRSTICGGHRPERRGCRASAAGARLTRSTVRCSVDLHARVEEHLRSGRHHGEL